MSPRGRDKEKGSAPSRPFWGAPSILLAIVLVASPMLIGGVHAQTAALVAALSLAGFWWALVRDQKSAGETRTVSLSIPALTFAFMGVICLVQLLPLPGFLYRLLQPTGYAEFARSWEVLGQGSPQMGWHVISVDPAATAEHGLKWFALAATAALAAQIISTREQRRKWLGVILASGGVVALAGAIQHLSGTEAVLGLYEAEISARAVAPFVNTNHAASYYGLMVIVALCFAYEHLRQSALLSSLSLGAAVLGVFLCAAHGSDGALLALFLALGALGVALLARTRPEGGDEQRNWLRRAVAGVFLAAVVGSFFVPDHWTVAEEEQFLSGTSAEARTHFIGAALKGGLDYPILGSGAGSVERALPPYLDWNYLGRSAVPTIENEPVEWIMTYGPAVALVTLLIFLLLLKRTAPEILDPRGRRGAVYAFALLLYLGVIAQFHFPFFTLGISVVAVVAIEACIHDRLGRIHLKRSPRLARLLALGLTLATVGVVLARLTVLADGPEETLQTEEEAAVLRAVRLYPTDGRLLSAAGLQARADGDLEQAAQLARRAFELRPHPQQEFLLARSLAAVGEQEEAAEIYRSLLDDERRRTGLERRMMESLARDLPEATLQARALSDASVANWRVFGRILFEQSGPTAAIDFALALVAERPDRAGSHLELIELYRRAGQLELAEMYARSLVARNLEAPDGERPAGLIALLGLLRQEGRSHEGRSIAFRAFQSGHRSEALAREVLQLTPPEGPRALTERDRNLFEAAIAAGCEPPYDNANVRRRCWEGRAFMAEANGQIEEARSLLSRVERHHEDPRPLGQLLVRQGECRELAGLQRRHGEGRFQGHLTRLAAQCARQEDSAN